MRRLYVLALVTLLLASCSTEGASPASTDGSEVTTTTSAGDGGGGTDDEAVERVRRAVEVTLAAERFDVDIETRLTLPDESLRVAALGWHDTVDRRADIVFTSSESGTDSKMSFVSDGETFWSEVPDDVDVPAGIRWIRSDVILPQGDERQTVGVLRLLYGLVGPQEWERIGETLAADDVDVTEYRAVASFDELVEGAATMGAEDEFRQGLDITGATDMRLELVVEIDEDDLIHRLGIVDEAAGSGPLAVDVRLVLGDFGRVHDDPLPPPDDETLTGPEADQLLITAFGG